MALTQDLDFQEGTNGANLTATGPYLAVSGPPTYDDIGPPHGLTMLCTNGDYVTVDTASVDNGAFSIHFEIVAVTTGVPRIITFTDTGTTFIGMFRAHTDGKFDIANGASTRVAASTNSWAAGFYRVDGYLGGSGLSRTVTLKVFTDDTNTSPVWDTGGPVAITSNTASAWTRSRPGAQGNSSGTLRILRVRHYDSQVFAGPLVAQVISTRTAAYDVLSSVVPTRATSWDVLARVTSTRATTWAVRTAVVATKATTWRVLARVAPTRVTSWRVLAAAVSSRATSWRVAARATGTRATSWRVLARVISTRATTWDVAPTTTTVVSTRSTTWAVGGAVTSVRATTWRVRVRTTAERPTSWRVLAQVSDVRAVEWRVLRQVAGSRNATWGVLGTATSTRSTSWQVFSDIVDRDLTLTATIQVGRFVAGVQSARFVEAVEPGRLTGEVEWR